MSKKRPDIEQAATETGEPVQEVFFTVRDAAKIKEILGDKIKIVLQAGDVVRAMLTKNETGRVANYAKIRR